MAPSSILYADLTPIIRRSIGIAFSVMDNDYVPHQASSSSVSVPLTTHVVTNLSMPSDMLVDTVTNGNGRVGARGRRGRPQVLEEGNGGVSRRTNSVAFLLGGFYNETYGND